MVTSASNFVISSAGLQRLLKTMVTYFNNSTANDSSDFTYDNTNLLSSVRTQHFRNLNPTTDFTTYTRDASGKLKEVVKADGRHYVFFGSAAKPDSIKSNFLHSYHYNGSTILDSVFETSQPPLIYSGKYLFTINASNNIASIVYTRDTYNPETFTFSYDNKKGLSMLVGVIIPDPLPDPGGNLFYLTTNNITGFTDSSSPASNYTVSYTYDDEGYPLSRKVTYPNGYVYNTVFKYIFK